MILNVWNEAVVPQVDLLTDHAGHELVHYPRCRGHLLRLLVMTTILSLISLRRNDCFCDYINIIITHAD